jgi:hypothetical protein
MAQQQGSWPVPDGPPPGWRPPPMPRPPSGLFPGAHTRPSYREPYPVAAGPLFAGLASGLLWMVLFGVIGQDLVGYAWWTLMASVAAWTVAAVLARVGDRGVAVGVAISAGLAWSIAAGFVAAAWIQTSDWPMW